MKISAGITEAECLVSLNALELESIQWFCSSLLKESSIHLSEGENTLSVAVLVDMQKTFHSLQYYNRVTLHITATLIKFIQEMGVKQA